MVLLNPKESFVTTNAPVLFVAANEWKVSESCYMDGNLSYQHSGCHKKTDKMSQEPTKVRNLYKG